MSAFLTSLILTAAPEVLCCIRLPDTYIFVCGSCLHV